MAFDAPILMALVNPTTWEYYTAQQADTGLWTVTPTTTVSYITLPEGWDNFQIAWDRNPDRLGCFRSTTETLIFSKDGRAILNSLNNASLTEAQCMLYLFVSDPINYGEYKIAYKANINFATLHDNMSDKKLSADLIDGGLYSLVETFGDAEINMPFWEQVEGIWTPLGIFCQDEGIKLMFDARFESSATVDVPLELPIADGLEHTIPSMVNRQIVPYIGNEILQAQMVIGSQLPQGSQTAFDNYTQSSYMVHCLIPPKNSGTFPTAPIAVYDMIGVLNAEISQVTYANPPAGETTTYCFYLYGIPRDDSSPSLFSTNAINNTTLTFGNNPAFADGFAMTSGAFSIINHISNPFNLYYDYVYVLVMTEETSDPVLLAYGMQATFTSLYFDLKCQSGDPFTNTDLRFPVSSFVGFRPHQVLEKLVPLLNSVATTPNGFPILAADTPYTGVSDYLSDPAQTLADNYDTIPYNAIITSGNALRQIAGQQYMTISLNSYLKSMFAIYGCAMGIDNDADGNPTVARVEPIPYFFDSTTQLFDLGMDITNLRVKALTEYIGGKLQTGYDTKWQDFSSYVGTSINYFGVDAFNFQQDYKLPFPRTSQKNSLDWIASIVADPYKIEVARADQNESNASSPSSSNANYIVELAAEATESIIVEAPDTSAYPVSAYLPLTYPSINVTTPATAPYGSGMLFPETQINLGLTPAKCTWRKGRFLSSICDRLAGQSIQFQKQYWQLYNGNVSIDASGISTNLNSGLITEVSDIAVNDLPERLFIPKIVEFETKQPLDMYNILKSNPRGYISFTFKDDIMYTPMQYKGFIWSVKQNIGNNSATTFSLLLLEDGTVLV